MNPSQTFKPEINAFFIVALIAVVLAVGGILLLRMMEPTPSPTPIAQQTPPPTPQQEVLDTSTWQTYRNEEFGFEVRYPSDWINTTKGSREEIGKTSTAELFTFSNQSEHTIRGDGGFQVKAFVSEVQRQKELFELLRNAKAGEIVVHDYYRVRYSKIADLTIGNMSAVKYKVKLKQNTLPEVLMVKGERALHFVMNTRFDRFSSTMIPLTIAEEKTFDQILSTFRFIDIACSPVEFAQYEYKEFKVDLGKDSREEVVRVYYGKRVSDRKLLPIMVKIFSGYPNCRKEELSWIGVSKAQEQELIESATYDSEVMQNIWGDGKDIVMVVGSEKGYKGDDSFYNMHFFDYQGENYVRFDGPLLSGLSFYQFYDIGAGAAKKLIVASRVPEKGECPYIDSCQHSYVFDTYTWNGKGYDQQRIGETKKKYFIFEGMRLEDILQDEPEILGAIEQEGKAMDWITHRNENFGFEIGYPKNWTKKDILSSPNSYKISIEPPGVFLIRNYLSGARIDIRVDNTNDESCTRRNESPEDTYRKIGTKLINGVIFDVGSFVYSGEYGQEYYARQKNLCSSITLVLSGQFPPVDESVKSGPINSFFDQILSTFRFINPE